MKEEKQDNCNFNKWFRTENTFRECKREVLQRDECVKNNFGNTIIVFGAIIAAAMLISLKIEVACHASNVMQYDLSEFIGQDYENAADEIGGTYDLIYSMTWPAKDNGWLRLWGEEVKRINYLQTSGEWTLCGLRPDMSEDEMEEVLNEQGFTELWQNVYYNEDDRFVILSEGVNEQTEITLHEINFGSHTDLQDLFTYIEQPMEYAIERIPDLESCVENGNVYYKKDGVEFVGSYAENVLEKDVIIEKIVISGDECPYSLYGVCPGDSGEVNSFPNFDEGGSGESFDPGGHLLVTVYSEYENPEISLSTGATEGKQRATVG